MNFPPLAMRVNAIFLKFQMYFLRGRQLWVRLTEVFHPVWLWWDSKLWHHTHSSGSPRSGQMQNAGLSSWLGAPFNFLRLASPRLILPLPVFCVCVERRHQIAWEKLCCEVWFYALIPMILMYSNDHNLAAWYCTFCSYLFNNVYLPWYLQPSLNLL